ncbi:MAG: transglycosylase SLT domain-containing protein [Gemmatimonadaceae bacterium]|nr:transglycosylase SLT domain-containing protein [Gemmatimonadaceae bacterium]
MRGLSWALAVILASPPLAVAAQAPRPREATPRAVTPRIGERRLAERNASRYDETFRRYAKRYFGPGFDWRYFKAQGMAESNLDPDATSYVGARGIMQLMPTTYAAIATRRPEFGAINDPEWNIAAGIMHDRYLWKLWSAAISERRPRWRRTQAASASGRRSCLAATTRAKGRSSGRGTPPLTGRGAASGGRTSSKSRPRFPAGGTGRPSTTCAKLTGITTLFARTAKHVEPQRRVRGRPTAVRGVSLTPD